MKADKQTTVSVELAKSVPINGKWHKRGSHVEVTPSLAKDLRRRGKVAPASGGTLSADKGAKTDAASRPVKQG